MSRLTLALLILALVPAVRSAGPLLLDPEAAEVREVRKRAEAALAAPLTTIVEKPRPSPTGNPRDYVSYAKYWWPDPAKPDGLPFVRRDGHVNKEWTERGDERALGIFIRHVEALALGWARLGREDCARRAGVWLRAWLADPATRMNPQFEYAQIRLGHNGNRGSSSGLIDTHGLVRVLDAVAILRGAPGFSAEDEAAVHRWFTEYLDWFLHSRNGRKERGAENNHGTWYLVQAVALARFLGRDAEARELAREDLARIDRQIEPDGRQPLEIARTDGLSYSLFNLEAHLKLARLAAPLGLDLWAYRAPRGGSLPGALDYLRPYREAPARWPHNQLAAIAPEKVQEVFTEAERVQAFIRSMSARP